MPDAPSSRGTLPRTFGRYRLEQRLGAGGMGEVYRAFDQKIRRDVAIKLVASSGGDETEGRARLRREARAAAAIEHPSAVEVYEVGEHEGAMYIAMELVEGRTLRARLADESPSTAEIGHWLMQVAEALAAAHALGLIHRDVKPDNVMVRSDGRAKVLDFGLARREQYSTDPEHEDAIAAITSRHALHDTLATVTAGGAVMGTLAYMSPEQLRREALDGRSDQFAWAVMAYEAFAGELPWGPKTDSISLVSAILSQPIDALPPSIPPAFSEAIVRGLAKRAADRHASMRALLAAIDGATNAASGTSRSVSRASVRTRVAPPVSTPPVSVVSTPPVSLVSTTSHAPDPTPSATLRSAIDLSDRWVLCERGHVVAVRRPLVFQVYGAEARAPSIEVATEAIARERDARAPVGVVIVVAHHGRPPDEAAREAWMRQIRAARGELAVLILYDGTSIRASIVRGVVTGILMVTKRREGTRVSATAAEGLPWLLDRLASLGAAVPSVRDAFSALEGYRGMAHASLAGPASRVR